ncbi:hypothetical protein L208DRAFT_1383069 [Tricholoma matsutake]|nr:hypothetical protein L208DRAFT_1383069 [Tricholoma matsutake 945]
MNIELLSHSCAMDALPSFSACSAAFCSSDSEIHGTVRSGSLFRALPWRSKAIGTSNSLNQFPQQIPNVRQQLLADEVMKMESLLFSQNNLVWHLEIASECENIAAVYNKLGKNSDLFRQFAWDILRYSILDIAIYIKCIRMGVTVTVKQHPVPPTAHPNIRFKSYDLFCTDWPAFLSKLLHSFDCLPDADMHITDSESGIVPLDGQSQGDTTEPDTVMFFFHSLCDCMMKMGKNHVIINFDLAAMYLTMILQVVLDNNFRRSTAIKIQMMWQSLGAFRPNGLRVIETKIWEALFDIATLKVLNTREMLVKLSGTVKDLLL